MPLNLHDIENSDSYQLVCNTLASYPKELEGEYLIALITSEAGEIAGKFGKHVRDNNLSYDDVLNLSEEDFLPIYKEMGDLLWGLGQLALRRNKTLQEIADMNIKKLMDRFERNSLHGSGDDR